MRLITQELHGHLYDGLLYAGENHHGLEEFLQQSVIIQPETIATNPSLDRRITYYKITAVRQ